MKHRNRWLLGATAFVLAIGGAGLLYTVQADPETQPEKPEHHEHERHPEIRKAVRELNTARKTLEKADHDFHGHRAAAIKAIDDALHELEEARKADVD